MSTQLQVPASGPIRIMSVKPAWPVDANVSIAPGVGVTVLTSGIDWSLELLTAAVFLRITPQEVATLEAHDIAGVATDALFTLGSEALWTAYDQVELTWRSLDEPTRTHWQACASRIWAVLKLPGQAPTKPTDISCADCCGPTGSLLCHCRPDAPLAQAA